MKEKRVKNIQWSGWVAITLLFILLVWVADLGVHGLRLLNTAHTVKAQFSSEMQNLSLTEASKWIRTSAIDLHALRRDMIPIFPLLRLISVVPNMDERIGQIEPMLIFADSLGQVGNAGLQLAEPLLSQDGNEELAKKLLECMLSHPEAIQQITDGVTAAGKAREQIRIEALPEQYRDVYAKVDAKFPTLERVAQILPLLPDWMGATRQHTYLLLAQNNDELRATGGFISGIGTVEAYQGQITAFDLGDSYRVDDYSKNYPLPPMPIQKYMLAGYWVTRDANWSPDFPTAARQTQNLYELSTGSSTDGVIAFDQSMLRRVLEAVGPLQVAGFDEPVTAETIEDDIQQAWAPAPGEGLSEAWWQQRKAFMGELGKALLNHIINLRDPAVLMKLVSQVESGICEGHLLIYFNDAASQTVLKDIGWDGGVHPGVGDYLMLVDSNIGFNKTDAVVERQMIYSVDLSQPSTPRAELRLRYRHLVQQEVACKHEASYGTGTYTDMMVRCYWDYWRVFVMKDVRLESVQAQSVPAEDLLNQQEWDGMVSNQTNEFGTQELAGLMVLPTNAEQETRLNLLLPGRAISQTLAGGWRYILHIQKQAGLESLPLILQIKFPDGCKVLGTSNEQWSWKGALTESKTLDLQCKPE